MELISFELKLCSSRHFIWRFQNYLQNLDQRIDWKSKNWRS